MGWGKDVRTGFFSGEARDSNYASLTALYRRLARVRRPFEMGGVGGGRDAIYALFGDWLSMTNLHDEARD